MTAYKAQVHLYAELVAPTLRLPELIRYLESTLPGLKVESRENFIEFHTRTLPKAAQQEIKSRLAEELARAKVRDPMKQASDFSPLGGEIDYEKRRLTNPNLKAAGILYDGLRMMIILKGLISRGEQSLKHIHLVFTNQLIGTWEQSDHRYHARVSVYGFPSLLSTSGIVAAPAKPREYYLLKQQHIALGMQDAAAVGLDQQFQGQFIDYDDERLTEVMKGYVMQAILYQLSGDPFCDDRNCRLYNAHWQQEVIQAQLKSQYEFCPLHQNRLQELRRQMLKG